MSSNGPDPDHPEDPFNPPNPYPADPYQQQAHQPGPYQPGPPPPGPYPPGYPPGPYPPGPYAPGAFPPGPPPPKKLSGGRIALIIGAVALVLICACLGVAGAALVRYAADRPGSGPATSAPGERPGQTPGGTAVPTDPTAPEVEPSASSGEPDGSSRATDFKAGDCLVNKGTDGEPRLDKANCATATWKVLAVVLFAADKSGCDSSPKGAAADAYFTHDEPSDQGDFVVCMRKLR